MNLYSQVYPEDIEFPLEADNVPVLIIPGLFGLTANWRRFARLLSGEHTVIIVDQRNHGRSEHADTQTYADMAADLLGFVQQRQLAKVILAGHSMGGKVAMLFSLLHPDLVERLIVMDIAPAGYQHNPAPFLPALLEHDVSHMSSRAEVERSLQDIIPDTPTRLFILQSLMGSAGAYQWRLNLPVINKFMSDISGFPDQLVIDKIYSKKCLFIAAGQSDYISAEHHDIVLQYFPNARHTVVPEAGHWLHVEKTEAVLEELNKFLKK